MTISIIGSEEKAAQDNFIIRKLSPTSYRIEESATLIEVTHTDKMFVTTVLTNNIGMNSPRTKVSTKEYLYRTKHKDLLKFTAHDNQLVVRAIPYE